MYFLTCANVDWNSRSLIRIVAVRMRKLAISGYPKMRLGKILIRLNLRCMGAHVRRYVFWRCGPKVRFLTLRFESTFCDITFHNILQYIAYYSFECIGCNKGKHFPHPFMPSELFWLNFLDGSISSRRDVWLVFINTIFYRHSCI